MANDSTDDIQAPVLETLLSSELEGVSNKEVQVSRVALPANFTLPWHWHPGEEFAYVLEGTVILSQEGEADVIHRAGQVVKIPYGKHHSASTGDDPAAILVFRVHAKGQPERVLVE